ncbi:hypothetical protein [Flagellimonas sp. CMM7]|uniref:hypothetical protein n=1 Tax=Flagellimonas sp. CMM7 TaxID=2654676 RepID=UPI0013CF5728|nr:hypothetical protein [Flagellimonas sp. CMM7]UII79512.1 hypothetical protein LV704_17855 [Flagellimonas sp. CMM7]
MRHLFVFLFVSLYSLLAIGQQGVEVPDTNANVLPRFTIDGIGYPVGVNDEIYKRLTMEYRISEKLQIQLQHFYDKFGTHEQTGSSLLLKWYVKKKLYLIAGGEAQYDINQFTGQHELMQTNLNIGMGYEVNPNLLLELGFRSRTNSKKATIGNFGRPVNPNAFSLRASF